MKLLRVLHAFLPSVELRVNTNLTRDIRDARRAHKMRRIWECRKIPVARPYWPEVPN